MAIGQQPGSTTSSTSWRKRPDVAAGESKVAAELLSAFVLYLVGRVFVPMMVNEDASLNVPRRVCRKRTKNKKAASGISCWTAPGNLKVVHAVLLSGV